MFTRQAYNGNKISLDNDHYSILLKKVADPLHKRLKMVTKSNDEMTK